jgi:hypothetical protein
MLSTDFIDQGDWNATFLDDDNWEQWAQSIDWDAPTMIPDVPALAGQLGG